MWYFNVVNDLILSYHWYPDMRNVGHMLFSHYMWTVQNKVILFAKRMFPVVFCNDRQPLPRPCTDINWFDLMISYYGHHRKYNSRWFMKGALKPHLAFVGALRIHQIRQSKNNFLSRDNRPLLHRTLHRNNNSNTFQEARCKIQVQ